MQLTTGDPAQDSTTGGSSRARLATFSSHLGGAHARRCSGVSRDNRRRVLGPLRVRITRNEFNPEPNRGAQDLLRICTRSEITGTHWRRVARVDQAPYPAKVAGRRHNRDVIRCRCIPLAAGAGVPLSPLAVSPIRPLSHLSVRQCRRSGSHPSEAAAACEVPCGCWEVEPPDRSRSPSPEGLTETAGGPS